MRGMNVEAIRTVFLFPGQGSQHAGMGGDLWAVSPAARALAERAAALTGMDLIGLMAAADEPTLADPEIAQVTIFTLSTALAAALAEQGIRPDLVAGHSLGEYTALAVSGALPWEEALLLVQARGRAMARAARLAPGKMAAISGLEPERVAALCAAASRDGCAVVANYNTPLQTVVAGDAGGIESVIALARAEGALKIDMLNVGGAYHSPLMAPARAELEPLIRRAPLRPPATAMLSSITGEFVTDIEAYRSLLLEQVTLPVRWGACAARLAALAQSGAALVEVGPGRVLGGLMRQISRAIGVLAACDGAALARIAS